jgi:hypothetical protein
VIAVEVRIDELMSQLGVWRAYDHPIDSVVRAHPGSGDPAGPLDERMQDEWAGYARALKRHVQPNVAVLTVPVQLTVDLDTLRAVTDLDVTVWAVADRLLTAAIQATPLPAGESLASGHASTVGGTTVDADR